MHNGICGFKDLDSNGISLGRSGFSNIINFDSDTKKLLTEQFYERAVIKSILGSNLDDILQRTEQTLNRNFKIENKFTFERVIALEFILASQKHKGTLAEYFNIKEKTTIVNSCYFLPLTNAGTYEELGLDKLDPVCDISKIPKYTIIFMSPSHWSRYYDTYNI